MVENRERNMLSGKKALITGADQGLGKEIAKEFLEQGASVCICSRDEGRLREAAKELECCRKEENGKVIFRRADVGITEDLDGLYEYLLSEFGTLDCVVNNAGIQGPIGDSAEVSWGKIEEVIRINLLGTLYGMRKAVSVFRAQKKQGRIVNLSGGGATGPRENFMGYALSKTGVVRATEIMAKETEKDGIYINAIAPGAMNTRMLDEVLKAGEEAMGAGAYAQALKQKESGGVSPKKAAHLAAYLASDRSGKISGRLISALWDGWESFGTHEQEIMGSDIYTLRRIVPKDRGFAWE